MSGWLTLCTNCRWLGTLDFPAVEIGFGLSPSPAPVSQHNLRMWPRDTVGEHNHINRTTVRRFGNAGIVTSQLSNEISFVHVHDGGLIGNDDACVHADNSDTQCIPWPAKYPNSTVANHCHKQWHHSWIHDCREKCVRGDDYTWQLEGHHLVIWNCGLGPVCRNQRGYSGKGCDRNFNAPAGYLTKGDFGLLYAATIFNVNSEGQGALVVPVDEVSGRGGALAGGSNRHSQFFNSVAFSLGRTPKPGPHNTKLWKGIFRGANSSERTLAALKLRDPARFDFRPTVDSPLRGRGFVYPPYTANVSSVDIGAYQLGDELWVPGCTFTTACAIDTSASLM